MTNYQVERLIRELNSPHLDNPVDPSGIPAPDQPAPLNRPWRNAAAQWREDHARWRDECRRRQDEIRLFCINARREAKKAVTAERRREQDRERKRAEAERAAAAQGKSYVFKPRRCLKGLSPQERADYERERERVKKERQRSGRGVTNNPLYGRFV